MTNEEAKKEAIKKAFGDKWELVKDDVDEIGSIRQFDDEDDACFWMIKIGFNQQDYDTIYSSISPDRHILKSLKDLQNNNGWIRIEPDGSNLPTDDRVLNSSFTVFDINHCDEEDMSCLMRASANGVIQLFKNARITHYKPITPEPRPVY